MSDEFPKKTYCYESKCGPVVQTGFHHEQYWVCRECKTEVSLLLKQQIDTKQPPKAEDDRNLDDDDNQYLWGF